MNNTNNTLMTTHQAITRLLAATLLGTTLLAQAATPVVIDNTDAGFSTLGSWASSTSVSGYQGSNYLAHPANGSPPGAIVVDNTDAGFSVTGIWPTSTSVGGYLGSNYQVHAANGEEPSAIVVDNTAGTAVGTWATSTSVGGYYGSNYQHHPAGAGANSFTWTPTIPTTGSYKVYARWTAHPNRSTQATYTVNHAGGATAVTVNQEANGGTWQLLGTFSLNAGSGHSVVLVDQGDGYVIADAIKVTPENAAPNTATWTPTIPSAGSYKVYARWTAHPNRASNAQYTVTHAGGDTPVTVDQVQNNGQWVLLGTYSMAPGSGHKVSLTDQANGYVIADAIRLLEASAPEFNTATWAPSVPAGQYEVYAKWTASGNRASNATYTVNHAQGTTQVPVNQQQNGGAFNLLGTFNLNGSSTITLTDQANGFVVADAIQLIPLTTVPKMYFVHTDHLNTPRLITSDTGQAVWSWANDDPYGNNAPNENPSGAGSFTCNLRLPGQYFDTELGTHYNYFRDYDPLTGRYVQSDPIGLQAGLNTYAYTDSNPLTKRDPLGLWSPEAHDYFINHTFRGLPENLRQQIINGSRYADGFSFQDPKFGYMHGMRPSNQTVDAAREMTCKYIGAYRSAFINLASSGDRQLTEQGFFALGMALHPVMDSTSPVHQNYPIWDGLAAELRKGTAFRHGPFPSSLESLRQAPRYLNETRQLMLQIMQGDLSKFCECK